MSVFAESGLENTRIGIVAGIIILGFAVAFVFGVIYLFFDFSRRLSKKETRKEALKEIKDSTIQVGKNIEYIATDKDFHKALHKEFKGTYIMLGVIAFLFILMALGVN